MNNWVVNIEQMLCTNIGSNEVFKIKYVAEENLVYCPSGDGKEWLRCVGAIRDEYLKQANIEAENILLEGK